MDFKLNYYETKSEVQKYPAAREMIKYLVADGRYDYIETGSLISIKENVVNILLPSEERKLKISGRYKSKVLSIYEQLPGFLSKHEKRVMLSNIVYGSGIDQYDETFFWLGNSMICNECFSCNDPNTGLAINEDRTYIKCYMGDTGLLVSHAFNESEVSDGELYRQILRDNLSLNKGMLFENAVAQCLTARGYKLFFYTHYSEEKHRNDIEIDFIISNGSKMKPKIFPIEVKSGKAYTTSSLDAFCNKCGSRIGNGYIIHPKNLSVRGNFICIPAYMTMCL